MTDRSDARAAGRRFVEASSLGSKSVRAVASRTPDHIAERILRLATTEALLYLDIDDLHRELERYLGAVELYDGQVHSRQRRSLVARFADARNAFAVAMVTGGTSLRIAVHAHPAATDDRAPDPADVDEVKAIGRAAHPGQVLVSWAAREAVDDRLPHGAKLLETTPWLDARAGAPRPLYTLVHDRSPGAFPPLVGEERRPGELPRYATRLLGREAELAPVEAAMQPGTVVTLVGAGALGKTRLAIELVRRTDPTRFPGGAVFIDTSTIADGDELVRALAAARLGAGAHWADVVRARPADLRAQVVASLQDPGIVVLSDCDHLGGAVGDLVADVARSDGRATVLATARASLGLPSARETVVEVGAPAGGASAALTLRPVPCALELTAPWWRTADPAGATRSHRPPPPTPGGGPVIPAEGPLRRLLGSLATFVGAWDRAGATAVAAAVGIAPADTGGHLDRLVDLGLVVPAVPGGFGVARYRLREAVRSPATDVLDPGDRDRAGEAHARYFLRLAELAAPARRTPEEAAWVRVVEAEFANLRAGWHWFAAQGRLDEQLQLVWSLSDDLLLRECHEVGRWAQEAADALGKQPHRLRCAALALASCTAFVEGHLGRAEQLAEKALRATADETVPGRWIAYNILGLVAASAEDGKESRRLLDEIGSLPGAGDDRLPRAVASYERAHLAWLRERPNEARQHADELEALTDERSSPTLLSMATLADGLAPRTESPDARHRIQRGMQLAKSARSPLLYLQGWRAANHLAPPTQDRRETMCTLLTVGEEFLARDNVNEAIQALMDLLDPLRALGADEPANAICGHLSTTDHQRLPRLRRIDRELRRDWSRRSDQGRPGERQAAYERGREMTLHDLVAHVHESVDRLAAAR